jgi:membrane-associated phospholipid phosphatase
MTAISKEELSVQELALQPLPQSRLSRLAYWVSQIGSPPLTGGAAAFLTGAVLATLSAWQWTFFYIVLTILAPCAYIIWLVQTGKAVDFHLPNREQRIRPLLFSLITAIVTWLIFDQMEAPRLLQMLATVNGIQTALFLAITLRWKISLHCTAATILSELAFVLLGTSAIPLIMTIPLIAWSRVYLDRHTVAQTIAGVLLGITILTPALYLYS